MYTETHTRTSLTFAPHIISVVFFIRTAVLHPTALQGSQNNEGPQPSQHRWRELITVLCVFAYVYGSASIWSISVSRGSIVVLLMFSFLLVVWLCKVNITVCSLVLPAFLAKPIEPLASGVRDVGLPHPGSDTTWRMLSCRLSSVIKACKVCCVRTDFNRLHVWN